MRSLKRRPVRRSKDRKVFSRTANRGLVRKASPMRGGIRL